jgi:hypothetical protein
MLQLRMSHHEAFSFARQPGHALFKNFRHAPQYSPQAATGFVVAVIFLLN